MSRDIEPSERTDAARGPQDRVPSREDSVEKAALSREPRPFVGRTYAYQLSPDQVETLYDVGRFRVLAVEDLAHQRYAARPGDMRQDLHSLLAQGLLSRRTLYVGTNREKLTVVALTKAGKEILP